MDVHDAQRNQKPSRDVPSEGSSLSQLTLEQTLKVVDLVKSVYKVNLEALDLIGALIHESPEGAKRLSELLGVPYTYGDLVKALVDYNVVGILRLAYEAGLL
jgi:hypothetical protein